MSQKLSKSLSNLYNYSIIQSSCTALIVSEYFNCQKVFLPLKYSNKFVYNSSLTDSHYSYDEISDIIAAMNFHNDLSSIKTIYSEMRIIPFEYQTLIHRISEYEDYYKMIQNESKMISSSPFSSSSPSSSEVTSSDSILSPFSKSVKSRKEDSSKVDYYCFWSFLMPIEIIYLIFRSKFDMINEASHSTLLNLCDKGALLFADKYLIKSLEESKENSPSTSALPFSDSSHEEEEEEKEEKELTSINKSEDSFQQMGYFIKSIIIDEIIEKDPSIIRKAIYPTK
jgi:hypothetical protein